MILVHTVQQGECIESIAAKYRTTVERVWDLDENTALREKREHPNVLLPGDVVRVPREPKSEQVARGQSNRFRLAGQVSRLKLRLQDALKQPLANVPYRLVLGAEERSGETSAEGEIDEPVPATVSEATLFLGESEEPYQLLVGSLDPVTELSGVQARLENLGFECGAIDGVAGPLTEAALRAFQRAYGLEETGVADDATRDKLLDAHGSQ